jgi:nitrous oxidase accessory protein
MRTRHSTILLAVAILVGALAATAMLGSDEAVDHTARVQPAFMQTTSVELAEPRDLAYGREIVVGDGGDVADITAALELAEDGDRIRVLAGTYTETPILIDKSIQLIGEGRPVLDGESREGILNITAPNVVVEGFVLRNTGVSHVRDHAAILLEKAHGCLIQNNVLEDTFFGIYLAAANDCEVRGNELRATGRTESSSGNGVHLWNVERATVIGNSIEGHRDGIYLEFAKSSHIAQNVSRNNIRYGLHYMFSDDSVYDRNVFEENGAGVAVMYSKNVVMKGNRFVRNWGTAAYGLLLKDVQDSKIEGNLFRSNTAAIHVEGADRLSFTNNHFERNGWAVKIQANAQDNVFTKNNFIDNTFDVVTNSRRSFNSFDGNYWSRYKGYDLSGDGIGDVPHRPVRLFSFIVETKPAAIILIRSFFVDVLEVAERVLPVLTPETLVDERPLIRAVTS